MKCFSLLTLGASSDAWHSEPLTAVASRRCHHSNHNYRVTTFPLFKYCGSTDRQWGGSPSQLFYLNIINPSTLCVHLFTCSNDWASNPFNSGSKRVRRVSINVPFLFQLVLSSKTFLFLYFYSIFKEEEDLYLSIYSNSSQYYDRVEWEVEWGVGRGGGVHCWMLSFSLWKTLGCCS